MYVKLSIISALSIVLMSLPAAAEQRKDFLPSLSKNNQQMVYYSYRDDEYPDLFVLDMHTGTEINLTNTPELWEIEPRFSPDGKTIAFSRGENMRAMHIYLINRDGTDLRKISSTKKGSNTGVHFSPDGQSVIFNNFQGKKEASLYKIDLVSGQQSRMTESSQGSFMGAVWSPDGKYIAATKQNGEKRDIYVMNTNGSHMHQVTDTPQLDEGFLNWTPDSNGIVSSVSHGRGFNHLYLYDLHGKRSQPLTENGANHSYFSSFSADGEYIFYDIGNWQEDFFVHKAKWQGQSVFKASSHDALLQSRQISGINETNQRRQLVDSHLAPLVGKWQGISTHGPAKGRFKEISDYRWGPNKQSLLVEMQMFWDDVKIGNAHGLLGLDKESQTVYYNLVMDDGTVLMQKQSNPKSPKRWEMSVTSTGKGNRFPNDFKVIFKDMKKDSWISDILWLNDGEYKLSDVHKFTRLK